MENCCLAVRAQVNIFTGQTTDKSRRRRHFAMCKSFVFFLAFSIMDDFRELELVVTSAPPPQTEHKSHRTTTTTTHKKTKHVFLFSVVLYFFLSYLKFAGPRRPLFYSLSFIVYMYTNLSRGRATDCALSSLFFIFFSSSAALLRNINGEKRRN